MERNMDIPPSVNVDLPPEIDREIQQLAEADGTSWTLVIHGVLWCFRGEHMATEARRQELVDVLQAAENSGPGIEVTPEWWEDFKRRAPRADQSRKDREFAAAGRTLCLYQ